MNGKCRYRYAVLLSDMLAVAAAFALNMLLRDENKSLADVFADTLWVSVPALLTVHVIAWATGKRRRGSADREMKRK